MFSSILKIIPKLAVGDLKNMERQLQSRFARVAKGFGKGLMGAIKGGGIAGIALGLIDKFLNPLKEVQEAIDRSLTQSDDIGTNAKQFGTTSGKLIKLMALGKSTGLEPEALFVMMNKFQNKIAEAQANPDKHSAVSGFVGSTDIAEAFYEFQQTMRGLGETDKNKQLLVQQEVFGEKLILKAADFFQTDLPDVMKQLLLKNVPSAKLSGSNNYLAGLNDKANMLAGQRFYQDIMAKAGVIKPGMVTADHVGKQIADRRMNANISRYENLAKLSQMIERMSIQLEKLWGPMGTVLGKAEPFFTKVETFIDDFSAKKFVRMLMGGGANGWWGKGD